MCNPSVCNCALVDKGSDGERKKSVRPVTVNQDIAVSPITCAFTLRRCVRTSLAFLAMRHVIQWAKIFYLTQRRNDATLRNA